MRKFFIVTLVLALSLNIFAQIQPLQNKSNRVVISLNGLWHIAEGTMDKIPETFNRSIVVPGLVDMAEPSFIEAGPKVPNRSSFPQKDKRRDAFWYRRTFKVSGPILPVAQLRIGKATYGTRVFLNGQLIGDHSPCFTAGLFAVKDALKPGENELIIRVGADRDAVAGLVESGYDGEKNRYIPGIYDNVELIMTGSPHIINVQAVPNIEAKTVTIHSWIKCLPEPVPANLHIVVRETKSRKVVGEGDCPISVGTSNAEQTGSITISLKNCSLWSPKDPFLYTVEVSSTADNFSTQFGMRSFRLDPDSRRAVLNGNPYFLRGTNVTLLRFFEDPQRGDKPWNEKWIRNLFAKFRDMHWNSLRLCIGFAPELWYKIADEEGFLIQDEYPIWYSGSFKSVSLKADVLAVEFREWMQERWNHPSVVIWDACNETYSPETGKAIQKVRALDFSNRPWDNGWGEPVDKGDVDECHPYHFIFGPNQPFRMCDLANDSGSKAGLLISQPYEKEKLIRKNALIINEYGGLWLNRDGSPTTLSQNVYDYLAEPSSTVEQRRELYARNSAAITEFFRAHRQAAGIMHFCGLGYSRSDGQTSDDWADLEELIWDPTFYKYMRDAFAPVGVMIDVWAEVMPAGSVQEFPIFIINDLDKTWKGEVLLKLTSDGKILWEKRLQTEVAAYGTKRVSVKEFIPQLAGNFQLQATLLKTEAGPVSSYRNFSVLSPQQKETRRNLALGKTATASSVSSAGNITFDAKLAFDGDRSSKWVSASGEQQWLAVDLGEIQSVSRTELAGEWGFLPNGTSIQTSTDGLNWEQVYVKKSSVDGVGNIETFRFETTLTRWVRILLPEQEKDKVFAISEFVIYH